MWVNEHSLGLSWDVDSSQERDNILYFLVEYSDLSAGTNHSFLSTEMGVNLTVLARGTTYRFSVKVTQAYLIWH